MTVVQGRKHSKICCGGFRPYPIPRGSASTELSDFWLRQFCRNFELEYEVVRAEVN